MSSPAPFAILIDHESVQPQAFGAKLAPGGRVYVFIGPQQARVSVAMLLALQELAAVVRYVRVDRPGRNAVDMVMTYCLGQLVSQRTAERYLILSKDTGFDALVANLKATNVPVERVETLVGDEFGPAMLVPDVTATET